jgi:hypothetical protein
MLFLFAVALAIGYPVAAAWAVSRGGPRGLWLTGSATLLLVAAAAALLGRHHAVPSVARLLLYALAFTGPVVVVPTALLSLSGRPGGGWAGRLPAAVLGAGVGIVCGWLLVIYGLGVW